MRMGPAGARRYYTKREASAELIKYPQTFHPCCPPFYWRAKCPKFWLKFRPRLSSDRRIFERQRSIAKQKQTCQGLMTGLPPYLTWDGWVPPTPRTVGAMGTPKGKSGKFLIDPPFQRPTPVSYTHLTLPTNREV